MHLWLSKNSDVPLREQLVRQIMLGVVSDDLKPGQRLPSTRELARRFRIHSNTVSAAYRDLERAGWLEVRKGSGVYVRQLGDSDPTDAPLDSRLELDRLISAFLTLARGQGHTLAEVQSRLKHWLSLEPPDHFLVVEPDEGLREILMAEIAEASALRVGGCGYEECGDVGRLGGAAVVALYSKAEEVRRALPLDASPIFLHTRSIPESLAGEQTPPRDALISVVSRWPKFLEWARVFLVAAGADADALDLRDAREEGWERGLRSSAYVITDALTARRLPTDVTARIYRIVADSSLEELRTFVERFLTGGNQEGKRQEAKGKRQK
ncbi:MAG: GntR family transcriptional regulator [Acidobacteriota bacterium]|jgi:GntR family transcriptional regulator|nr:GntR family transcriptional regulator [Acidobacteriota bacterium]